MPAPLLLAASALVLVQTQSTFYAAWEDGRDAEGHRRFDAAAAAYRRAAQLRPHSAAQVLIYGNNLLPAYYPYTRIARCEVELGHLDAAEQALAQAEREAEPAPERQALQARVRALRPAPPVPSAPVAASPAPAAEPAKPPAASPAAPGILSPQAAPPAAAEPARVPAAAPAPVPAPAPPSAPASARAAASPSAPAAPASLPPPPAAAVARPARPGWLIPLALLAAGSAWWWWPRRRRAPLDQAFRAPEQVGPYRLIRLLGRGGFASTYLARKDGGGPPVALKLLHPFRQDDPEFLGRFRQEARLGARLQHPGIVALLDQAPPTGLPWLAMEYVEGLRLDEHLKRRGALPVAEALDLALQLAAALGYAHGQGVIHRDLKPANVMLVGGRAKIMDFGIARSLDSETLTTTYAFLGTPRYAAPELQQKSRVGPAADSYALGIVLFEMLAGEPPFQGETPFEILDQHRSRDLPDLAALRPDAPAPLVDLVRALTRKDPAQRPGDPEVVAALEALAVRA